jgi:Domain of unknown function (DUF4386)
MLIALNREPAADAALTARYVKLGGSVLGQQMLSIPFALGALMFYSLLYRSRLVPRWLSEWGLVGAVLYIGAPLLRIFGRSFDFLYGPLALQEMVMAVWLIVKGFEPVERRSPSNTTLPSPTQGVDVESSRDIVSAP